MQKNITLSLGQRLNISLKLKPGAISETIKVTDAPPLLQSQDSSVGQVLSSQESMTLHLMAAIRSIWSN